MVPISDTRGVRDVRVTGTTVAGGSFEPDRTFVMVALATALRPDAQIDKGEQSVDLTLQVAGTYSLSFIPTARSTSC
jgi:inner membrane protein involved in colicin E2 resistance